MDATARPADNGARPMIAHTIRIELRDGTVIRGHVITDDAARVLRVFRDCADVVAAECEPA